jgi:hypothetical protein
MEVLHSYCAGLDVHKDSVVGCVRHMVDGTVKREVRTFKTTTADLMAALSAWLAEEGCTHVVMEATGVYWRPVWCLAHSIRWRVRIGACQRRAREERAGPQDRRVKIFGQVISSFSCTHRSKRDARYRTEVPPNPVSAAITGSR